MRVNLPSSSPSPFRMSVILREGIHFDRLMISRLTGGAYIYHDGIV